MREHARYSGTRHTAQAGLAVPCGQALGRKQVHPVDPPTTRPTRAALTHGNARTGDELSGILRRLGPFLLDLGLKLAGFNNLRGIVRFLLLRQRRSARPWVSHAVVSHRARRRETGATCGRARLERLAGRYADSAERGATDPTQQQQPPQQQLAARGALSLSPALPPAPFPPPPHTHTHHHHHHRKHGPSSRRALVARIGNDTGPG